VSAPFDTSLLLDGILVLVALEAAFLTALWRSSGAGLAPTRFLPTLLAGAFLLLALRDAVADAPWHRIWLWLTLALIAHVVDLLGRWRRPRAKETGRPSD
jgi:hypothetical protein